MDAITAGPAKLFGRPSGMHAGARPLGARARSLLPGALLIVAGSWLLRGAGDHQYISFSDGVYSYLASVVAQKGPSILYSHLALSQPPAPVLLGAVAWKLGGGIEGIRLGLALMGILTVGLAYVLARRLSLDPLAASVAGALVAAGPMRAQFGGLDGEAFLAVLYLAVALTLANRKPKAGLMGFLIAVGFVVKLTWAPVAVVTLAAVWRQGGRRVAARTAASAGAWTAALYFGLMMTFGWSAASLASQLVLAESHSGLQLSLVPGIILIAAVIWWPIAPLAAAVLRSLPNGVAMLLAAAPISILFMLKQGTFENVLVPFEPLMIVAATMGAMRLWNGRRHGARALAALSCAGVLIHALSVSLPVRSPVPVLLSAEVLDMNNQARVDAAVAALENHSSANQPVMVNPYIALRANRHEVDNQADWFILHAMATNCTDRAGICAEWGRMKRALRGGRVSVAGVDSNVAVFDPPFRSLVTSKARRLLFHTAGPPLTMSIYALKTYAQSSRRADVG